MRLCQQRGKKAETKKPKILKKINDSETPEVVTVIVHTDGLREYLENSPQ